MEKLIVVGMRYCDKIAIDKTLKAFKAVGTTLPLDLRLEPNADAPNGKAIAVYNDRDRVGYIRNADLAEALSRNAHLSHYWKYTLRTTQTNYWILEGKAVAAVKSPPWANGGVLSMKELAGASDLQYSPGLIAEFEKQNMQYATDNDKFLKKDEKKMINTNSMRDSFFREVKNVAIDMQSGKFGIITNEGISVFVDGGISVNPITDFGVKVPAFAMRVAITDLKAGDIIVGGTEPTFFVGLVKDGGYEVVTMSGEHKLVGTVTNMFFGKNTVLAVKNMFGEGMNPMMMALMMGDDSKGDGFDMKTFALMSMMGNMGGKEGATGMDPNMLMMMMMMGK